jgi:putative DNA primase/helicase
VSAIVQRDEIDVAAVTTSAEPKGGKVADKIVELVRGSSTDLIWDGEHAYSILQALDHVRCIPVRSTAFRRWVHDQARRSGMSSPSGEAFKTAEVSIEAMAEANGVKSSPSIRIASIRGSGEIFLDLGGDDWKCVHVTKEGWEVVPHPIEGPYMYRPPRMAALPLPERGGDLGRLWNYLNIARDDERLLLLAAVVQMFWPRGPYPVLVIYGEQGSTKTTTEEMIKSLTDPSRPAPDKHALSSLRPPPGNPRDVTAVARGARVIGFDNVSYLDDWLSDTICRLSTGAELGGRELFSDFDEAIISVARPVMLNGIPEVVGRADLADRSIKIEARPPKRRVKESKLWSAFDAERPVLLGALLDLLSATLARYDEAKVPDELDVRMADFAHVGEAVALAMGRCPGDFTRGYHASRTHAAREVAELDSLTPLLDGLLDRQPAGEWIGGVSELLGLLETASLPGKGWWSSPKALQVHLTRQGAPLKAAGIQIEKLGRGRSPISRKPLSLYRISRMVATTLGTSDKGALQAGSRL